ncbi:MAG: hypothetical protein KJ623_04095 [Nanoarchaeota archaeon]|nr:hypothetical protein [Nanoarchaeota archaeon]MBU0962992.1 hypothetical protein [Nanoarchaeota archaeon]
MGYNIYSTREEYDCSKGLSALKQTFDSLQCSMTACGGNKKSLDNICRSCENYINNALLRDAASME